MPGRATRRRWTTDALVHATELVLGGTYGVRETGVWRSGTVAKANARDWREREGELDGQTGYRFVHPRRSAVDHECSVDLVLCACTSVVRPSRRSSFDWHLIAD